MPVKALNSDRSWLLESRPLNACRPQEESLSVYKNSPDEVDEAFEGDRFWGEGPRRQLPAVDHGPAVGVRVVALDGHRVLAGQTADSVQASGARGGGAVVHGVRHGRQGLPAVQHVVVPLGAVRRHHVQLTSQHTGAVVLPRLQHGRRLRPLVDAGVVAPDAVVEARAVGAAWRTQTRG